MKKKDNTIPIEEPTDDQILQTQKAIKEKFDIKVPKADAYKLVKIIKELKFYCEVEEIDHYYAKVDDKAVEDFQKLMKEKYNQELSTSEAREQSQGLMVFVVFKEKDRLAKEMREILTKHRQVNYDPVLLEKVNRLFKIHYDIDLKDDRQRQLLHFISKNVWFEEGLDVSVDQILDELIKYADKRKRGKRTYNDWKYKKLKQNIDWVVNEEKLTEGNFTPLYYDEHEVEITSKDGELYIGERKS